MLPLGWPTLLLLLTVLVQTIGNSSASSAPSSRDVRFVSAQQMQQQPGHQLAIRRERSIMMEDDEDFPAPEISDFRKAVLNEFASSVIRKFISFERHWYDIMARLSSFEVGFYLTLGVIGTYFLIYSLLTWLGLFAPLRIKRQVTAVPTPDEPEPLYFSLDRWEDQLSDWIERTGHSGSVRLKKHYRCCLIPEQQDKLKEAFARCHPMTSRSIYPWNNPCSTGLDYRDFHVPLSASSSRTNTS